MTWRERLADIADTPWPPLGTPAAVAVAAAVLWALWQASAGDRWVPILDSANLVFHEAGHPIAGLFSARLAVYGGTLGQLAFPVATCATFWSRRHTLGYALCFGWTCESLLNVATYMGDARAMRLPLIGGLDPEYAHDWREILQRWGMLELDTAWAGLLRVVVWVAAIGLGWWILRRWRDGRE